MSEILNEHQNKNKDGDILGIFRVDTKNARGIDLWARVDAIIQSYVRIHPKEIATQLEMNKQRNEVQKNDFGSGVDIRIGVSIPVGLLIDLERIEPALFSNKNLFHKFMEKYPGFRVPTKV